jgi:hypothetical protein
MNCPTQPFSSWQGREFEEEEDFFVELPRG